MATPTLTERETDQIIGAELRRLLNCVVAEVWALHPDWREKTVQALVVAMNERLKAIQTEARDTELQILAMIGEGCPNADGY